MKNNPSNLSFSMGNAKLSGIWTFSLPAGHTCPGARECLAIVPRDGGPIVNGKDNKFRCFAASMENLFPNVRKSRWSNFDKLKASKDMASLIVDSLPGMDGHTYRIHVSGDFFNLTYFKAWIQVAKQFPNRKFYAYTKSIKTWVSEMVNVPENFILTASYGGRFDDMIESEGLKYAKVVFTEKEANDSGLEIDHDDSHAFNGTNPFALLLHGKQKAGTKAAEALRELKRQGLGAYKPAKPY
jgi:hypothetical protein